MVSVNELTSVSGRLPGLVSDFESRIDGFNSRAWRLAEFEAYVANHKDRRISIIPNANEPYGCSFKVGSKYVIVYNPALNRPILDLVVAHEFSHIMLGHTDLMSIRQNYTSTSIVKCDCEAQMMALLFWVPSRVLFHYEIMSEETLTFDTTRMFVGLAHGYGTSHEVQVETLRRFALHSTVRMSEYRRSATLGLAGL